MSQSISVQCPQCHSRLKLKSSKSVGKKIPCPKCEFRFVVETDAETSDDGFPDLDGADLSSQGEAISDADFPEIQPKAKRRSSPSNGPMPQNKKLLIAVSSFLALSCVLAIIFLVTQQRANRQQKISAATASAQSEKTTTSKTEAKPADPTTDSTTANNSKEASAEAESPENPKPSNVADQTLKSRPNQSTTSAALVGTRKQTTTKKRRVFRSATSNSTKKKPATKTRRTVSRSSTSLKDEDDPNLSSSNENEETAENNENEEKEQAETDSKKSDKKTPKKKSSTLFSIMQPLAAVKEKKTNDAVQLAQASRKKKRGGRRGDDDDDDGGGFRIRIDPKKLDELKKKKEEHDRKIKKAKATKKGKQKKRGSRRSEDDDENDNSRGNNRSNRNRFNSKPRTRIKPKQPSPNVRSSRLKTTQKQMTPADLKGMKPGSPAMPPTVGNGGMLSKAISFLTFLIAPDGKLPTKMPPKRSAPLVGKQIEDVSAATTKNTILKLSQIEEDYIVVTFMGVECPLANLYFPRLAQLQKEFEGESVAFLVVNSNDQDTLDEVRKQARQFRTKYPVIKDAGQNVAKAFGATRTPEVFVLDKERVVKYHGLIDDQYGYFHRRPTPTQHYVYSALVDLLNGDAVEIAETEATGCHIGIAQKPDANSSVTYYKDVLPVFQTNCQECHREKEIGPFALEDYEDVKSWGETIKEAIVERRMPPWKADPKFGKFKNDMSLSEKDIQTVVDWVDNGCPAGNKADSPPPMEWTKGWNIGRPNKIYSMRKPFVVPATGVVDYQHIVVSPPFKKDQWIQAAECRYGNASVVHHMLVLLRFPGYASGRNQDGLRNGFFASGVPGSSWIKYPKGYAKRIPKGARLVFQMHYTPNGKRTADRSRLGIVWANKSEITHEIQTYAITPQQLNIPAGDAKVVREQSETMPQDVYITSLMPHLHLRGTSFKYLAEYPDGRNETVLSIPFWDFNWQHQYHFKEPKLLPEGTKLKTVATWDNSASNPNNILPPVDVRFGEQTTDEMFIGYVNYVVPLDEDEFEDDARSSR